jgi:hypothetical protein
MTDSKAKAPTYKVVYVNLTKEEIQDFYESAIKSDVLTVADLLYQRESAKKASFERLVAAAYAKYAIEQYVSKLKRKEEQV